jgi:hypothetical protein
MGPCTDGSSEYLFAREKASSAFAALAVNGGASHVSLVDQLGGLNNAETKMNRKGGSCLVMVAGPS